jgi:carboxypeptidase Taq
MPDTWEAFDARQKEIVDLSATLSLLDWDQQTMMPPKGAKLRPYHRATIATIAHERLVDDRLGELIDELGARNGELDEVQRACVRNARRLRDRSVAVGRDLVRELSLATSAGYEVWQRARPARDFELFRPALERIVELKKREADAIGHDGERYDALLDRYEPGMRVARLEPLLNGLRDDLVPFVRAIFEKPEPEHAFLSRTYPEQGQWDFTMRVLGDLGFDLLAGRQDRSAHPFTSGTSPVDVRVTTRFLPGDPRSSVMATIHEAGHGMYEQGLNADRLVRTFAGQAASLGMHESQSRLWENQVGRSRPFWEHYFPVFQGHFPGVADDVNATDMWRAVNLVQPSLIRVEADEVTYNLHILLRFELELALLRDELAVADLPEAWNQSMQRFLGITPPHDGDGVLQDIHWSGGSIGYFPTYTLGNLYGAQLFEALENDVGPVEESIREGEFGAILAWLRQKIHSQGHVRDAEEIARAATGKGLEHTTLMAYLRRKYGELYDVA